jgi:hypothetical protein
VSLNLRLGGLHRTSIESNKEEEEKITNASVSPEFPSYPQIPLFLGTPHFVLCLPAYTVCRETLARDEPLLRGSSVPRKRPTHSVDFEGFDPQKS